MPLLSFECPDERQGRIAADEENEMTGASGIDWATEFPASLWWIAKAWLIASIVLAASAAALARHTEWGRQFWRITGRYFLGSRAWRSLGLVAALIALAVAGVRVTVLFSYQSNDMFSALQFAVQGLASGRGHRFDAARDAFWASIRLFVVLSVVSLIQALVVYWASQVFIVDWWRWLSHRMIHDWLADGAYYRARHVADSVDNPDQRIQQDAGDLVMTSYTLVFGAQSGGVLGCGTGLVSFVPILWRFSDPIHIYGLTIPKALTCVTFLYVGVSSLIAFRLGHPLIRLNFRNQQLTANFRYALVRLREHAESVAFYRGEDTERSGLLGRFDAMLANYWLLVYRTLAFNGWNLMASQTSGVFTYLFMAPRLFAGRTTIGDIQQAAMAFGEVQWALSFFRENYSTFTAYRAMLSRLDGLLTADAEAAALPVIVSDELDAGLCVRDLDVRRPDGSILVRGLDMILDSGDAVVITGPSGCGKTTLLRSVAGLWPYSHGGVGRPSDNDTMFLAQQSYLPLGTLAAALTYPAQRHAFDDDTLRAALLAADLERLSSRLDHTEDWASVLSLGEQQRIGFARVLLARPRLVFLDEATSAVDEPGEQLLYRLLRDSLPDTTVVSVAHRRTVEPFHDWRLDLDGSGGWRINPSHAATSATW
jgi:putative ATP-binding cassette transporter